MPAELRGSVPPRAAGRSSARDSMVLSSWISGLQRDILLECEQARHEIQQGQNALGQLKKFAEDDWGTTKITHARISDRIDSHRRRIAESLITIMNTQVTRGPSSPS